MNKYAKLSLLPMLVIATVFYTFLSYAISANSDNMSSLLIAKDIAEGNIRLDGWSMSTQSYFFSDIIWSAMAIKLFGYHYLLVHILPALMYSIMLFTSIALAKNKNRYGWVWLLPVVIFPTVFSGSVSFELNIHGGIYLFSVLFIFYLEKNKNNISALSVFLLSLACGLLIDSDKLFLYIFTIPLFAASMIHFMLSKNKKLLVLSAVSVGSVVVYKIYPIFAERFFLYKVPGIQPPEIANFNIFKTNLSFFIDGVKHLFGFVNNDNNISVLFYYSNLLFCIVFVIVSFYCVFKYLFNNFIDTFLVLSSCISISAFLFSNVPNDYSSARYFYSALLFLSLLVSRNIQLGQFKFKFLLLIAVTCSVGNLYNFNRIEPNINVFYKNLSDFLADKGLKSGYAPYWEAAVLSGHGKQSVIPVDVADYITPSHWLSKYQDYEMDRNFFMSSDKKNIEIAINQFGKPEQEYHFGNTTILKWSKIQLPPCGITFQSIPATMRTQVGSINNGKITSSGKPGYLIYGPYAPLNNGKYILTVSGMNSYMGDEIEVVDNSGKSILFTSPLKFNINGTFTASFEIPRKSENIEVRIKTENNPNLILNGYTLESK